MRLIYVFFGALAIALGIVIFGNNATDKPTATKKPTYSDAAVVPFLPAQYPTWYAKWGEAAFTRINSRLKSVADTAAMQSGCSELELVSLSEAQSQPPRLFVFIADCKSGSARVRYYIDEQLNIINTKTYNF